MGFQNIYVHALDSFESFLCICLLEFMGAPYDTRICVGVVQGMGSCINMTYSCQLL